MRQPQNTTLAPRWTTGCCDRTPRFIGGARYVCIVCGQIWVDTAIEIRAVFGPGVEKVIVREPSIAAPDD